jgi:hypothetical protein
MREEIRLGNEALAQFLAPPGCFQHSDHRWYASPGRIAKTACVFRATGALSTRNDQTLMAAARLTHSPGRGDSA